MKEYRNVVLFCYTDKLSFASLNFSFNLKKILTKLPFLENLSSGRSCELSNVKHLYRNSREKICNILQFLPKIISAHDIVKQNEAWLLLYVWKVCFFLQVFVWSYAYKLIKLYAYKRNWVMNGILYWSVFVEMQFGWTFREQTFKAFGNAKS